MTIHDESKAVEFKGNGGRMTLRIADFDAAGRPVIVFPPLTTEAEAQRFVAPFNLTISDAEIDLESGEIAASIETTETT